MKFFMIFKGVDQATKVMSKIMAAEKKLTGVSARGASKAAAAAGRVSKALNGTARAAKAAFNAVQGGARKAGRAVADLHRKTVALGKRGLNQIKTGAGKIGKGLAVAGALAATVYGGAALAAHQLVGTASEFERFNTILETTEGSSAKARKTMEWVSTFAVKTPYELSQVTDSFVKLRSYGLDPTNGLLKTLGDTSAAMGKPLNQAVEAMADAVTGENERLKEFGITAAKVGDKITYAYTNAAGKTMKATVKAGDRMSIQMKLMEIFNQKYGGAMGKLSATWEGMISNLWDLWAKFQLMIMNAGLFDWMKDKLRTILDTISELEANGQLQEWATRISEGIQTALMQIWEFGKGVISFLQQAKSALQGTADFVGGWDKLALIFAALPAAGMLASIASGIVLIASGIATLGVAVMANPIGLTIAAIAAAVYLLYDNWSGVGEFFSKAWNAIADGATNAWDIMKGLFDWSPAEAIERNFGAIGEKIGAFLDGAASKASAAWQKVKSVFSSESAVDIAARDPVSIEHAAAAANKLKGALDAANAIDLSGTSGQINRLSAEANKLPATVRGAVSAANAVLTATSFHHHGVRLMETLAAGMKARAQAVVNQIRATMQEVRNHLPSSPAKTGPLKDIHRLKFAETIARSIRPGPMVRAMKAAAAATMLAASPALATTGSDMAVSEARSVRAAPATASRGGVTIEYKPVLHLSGDAQSAQAGFKKQLDEHSRHIKKLVDEELRREERRKY